MQAKARSVINGALPGGYTRGCVGESACGLVPQRHQNGALLPSCLSPCTHQGSTREGGPVEDAHLCSHLCLQNCLRSFTTQKRALWLGASPAGLKSGGGAHRRLEPWMQWDPVVSGKPSASLTGIRLHPDYPGSSVSLTPVQLVVNLNSISKQPQQPWVSV